MSSGNSLPVVLISAADADAAASVISQLAENIKDLEESDEDGSRVWRVVNKYYSIQVKLLPWLDTFQNEPPPFEAHVIYLTEAECLSEEAVSLLERRAAAAGGAGEVLLAMCEAGAGEGGEAERLDSAARKVRYEYVPLREVASDSDQEDEDQPFPELYGASRARAALHAHTWPGVAVVGGAGGEEVVGEEGEESEAEAEGRAEVFAAALERLGSALQLDAAERRERAPLLLHDIAAALGLRSDLL